MTTIQEMMHERGKTALFFDTETSGLPNKGGPVSLQPCTVQLAWVLALVPQIGDEYRELASFSGVIKLPQGYEVSKGAEGVHGISTMTSVAYGVPFAAAWELLLNAADIAELRVAHNIGFDDNQLRFDCTRLDDKSGLAKFMRTVPVCTMEMSKDLVQLPPTPRMVRSGRTGFKTPKLSESYAHFTGESLTNAHDAMADVRGCMRILLEMMRLDNAEH